MAIQYAGGRGDSQSIMATADGFSFELLGTMFALRGWSDSMGEILFAVGERTAAFVYPIDDGSVPLRTPSNKGEPPEGLDDVTEVQDAAELSLCVAPHFYGWSSHRDYAASKLSPKND